MSSNQEKDQTITRDRKKSINVVIPYASAHVFLVFEAMSLNRDTVSSEQLGHPGLVAATIRQLGIIEKIDVPEDARMPTYGYSKANRPDLKQVMLSLTQGGVANIPLSMEIAMIKQEVKCPTDAEKSMKPLLGQGRLGKPR